MKRNRWFAAALGALVLLAMSTTVNAQTAISRPWTMTAESQQVIRLSDGAVMAHASGQGSHFGNFTAEGWGYLQDPVSYGTITAANGDLVHYEGGTGGLYTITGGTGRFTGATGSFVITVQMIGQPVIHPDGTMTIDLRWTAVGTITF